jgi:hypothetical protein
MGVALVVATACSFRARAGRVPNTTLTVPVNPPVFALNGGGLRRVRFADPVAIATPPGERIDCLWSSRMARFDPRLTHRRGRCSSI